MAIGDTLDVMVDTAIEVRLAGQTLWAGLARDRDESERRRVIDLGPVFDRDLLEALASLPLGVAVNWSEVDPLQAVHLDVAPPGCVTSDECCVTRVFAPVVEPLLFVLETEDVRRGAESVSLFAADAARMVVTSRAPRREVLDLAADLEVGVALTHGEVLVAPTWGRVRPGPRRWYVQELLWDAARQSTLSQALR